MHEHPCINPIFHALYYDALRCDCQYHLLNLIHLSIHFIIFILSMLRKIQRIHCQPALSTSRAKLTFEHDIQRRMHFSYVFLTNGSPHHKTSYNQSCKIYLTAIVWFVFQPSKHSCIVFS
jgi:hypothetical protein